MSSKTEDPSYIAVSENVHFTVPASPTSTSLTRHGTAFITAVLPATEEQAARLRRELSTDLEKSYPGASEVFDDPALQASIYPRRPGEWPLASEAKLGHITLPDAVSDAIFGSCEVSYAELIRAVNEGKDLFSVGCRSGTTDWNKRAFLQFLQDGGGAEGTSATPKLVQQDGKPSTMDTTKMQCPVVLLAGDEKIAAMATIELKSHEHQLDRNSIDTAADTAASTTAHTFKFKRAGVLESDTFSLTSAPGSIKTADGASHNVGEDALARLTVELPQNAHSRKALEEAIPKAQGGEQVSYPDLAPSGVTSTGKTKHRSKPVRWEQKGVRVESIGPRSTLRSSAQNATTDPFAHTIESETWPVRLTSADGKEVLGMARYRIEPRDVGEHGSEE